MKKKINWPRIIYIVGVVALIIGAIDPLEGSIIIAVGSILITFAGYLTHDRHRKLFLWLSLMIVTSVFFLFFFSWLGGFGGKSTLSWWWGILILPYPIAWLTTLVLLIIRAFKKPKPQAVI